MEDIHPEHITADEVKWPSFINQNIYTDILRLDKIHPQISGNKWFKLRYYIEEAKQKNKSVLVSFGGAWSNHIVATAACARLNELQSIGIIRGEKPATPSKTLDQAAKLGMTLYFVSREDYRSKKIPFAINDEMYLINEGGFGEPGVRGASTILDYCDKNKYSHICCAAGTGTMTAGLLNASPNNAKILSVVVMRSNPEIQKGVVHFTGNTSSSCEFIEDYHFGGYAKYDQRLIDFMNEFYRVSSIPTDFVYTAKLCYAISDLAEKKYFEAGSRILLIHSGGLQGNTSMDKGTLIF